MRKIFLFIFLILITFPANLFAYDFTYETDDFEHMMIGFVDRMAIFTVTINESYLPFDLDGVDVAYNKNYITNVRGIQVGTYSVIANTPFNLYIAHTPLTLIGTAQQGKLSAIDYRLYVFGETGFQSQVSDALASSMASNFGSITNIITVSGSAVLENRGLYVSMDDKSKVNDENLQVSDNMTREEASTKAVLADLNTGSYESTIYFLLVVDE